jgi:putative transcriptional regulator
MKLGNHIRRLRFEKSEMTQQQLADRIGTSRMTVYSIELGKFVPSTLLAMKIAGVFGKTVEEVFYFVEEEHERRKNRK